jgi:hypothetical protein
MEDLRTIANKKDASDSMQILRKRLESMVCTSLSHQVNVFDINSVLTFFPPLA